MPTDPFVPPDPDARPRQQQNLPPGVALPPAAGWRADRSGDSAQPGEVRGELFGSPGPNVGYAYTITERVKDRLRLGPHEHLPDVIAVVAEIAAKRAALFGRAPVIGDVEHAISLLGYDGSANSDFVEARSFVVHDAGHDYPRRRTLVDAVKEDLLRGQSVDAGKVEGWRASTAAKLVPEMRDQPLM